MAVFGLDLSWGRIAAWRWGWGFQRGQKLEETDKNGGRDSNED